MPRSRTSGRWLAASTMTKSVCVKPSISLRSGERLLALVVASAKPRAALAADGVDLVDGDDRRRVLFAVADRSRTRLAPTPDDSG